MTTWKAGGYQIREYLTNEHGERHVHVLLDGDLIAVVFVPSGVFRDLFAPRHRGRILRALRQATLIP